LPFTSSFCLLPSYFPTGRHPPCQADGFPLTSVSAERPSVTPKPDACPESAAVRIEGSAVAVRRSALPYLRTPDSSLQPACFAFIAILAKVGAGRLLGGAGGCGGRRGAAFIRIMAILAKVSEAGYSGGAGPATMSARCPPARAQRPGRPCGIYILYGIHRVAAVCGGRLRPGCPPDVRQMSGPRGGGAVSGGAVNRTGSPGQMSARSGHPSPQDRTPAAASSSLRSAGVPPA